MFDFFEQGGVVMYPLLFASLLMIVIIVERLIMLRQRRIIIPEIINVIENIHSAYDIELAKNICTKYNGPLPNLIRIGLESEALNKHEIRELIEDQGRQEIRKLEKWLAVLETIAVSGPLLGLLGTVIGMINVFKVITAQGIGQASALAGGIYQALFTTVFGLIIGIIALIFFNYFTHKAENFVLDIEKNSNKLIYILDQIKHKPNKVTDHAPIDQT
jgi:biopolymer transport protein ExbB